ncbi:MAG TPA: polyprenyl synthetase family protein [Spirochaetia bacterium]|nr:polyprenyl synthetase family protein [Spirochaetia bacterium]
MSGATIALEYFAPFRERLADTLRAFLEEKRGELARVSPIGSQAAERLLDFSVRGKMIRGCLVHLGWALGRRGESDPAAEEAVRTAGAAMELFQSGLLVHDDIMDRDPVRRGQPSFFRQYEEQAARDGAADPAHVGQSLAICAGDAAYFMAFELLARIGLPGPLLGAVLGLCARELTAVGIAQMQDVAWGAAAGPAGLEEVLRMYTYKTGRYSFSLPLLTGALLAGAPDALRSGLEECGETIGLLFQLRDDELGLFGDEEQTGKPLASDLREGKKTIVVSLILEQATRAERDRLAGILGNPRCTADDLDFVRRLARSAGVQERLRALTGGLVARAQRAVSALPTPSETDRAALRCLLDFTTSRSW